MARTTVEVVVRECREPDEEARRTILESATRELRKTYRPREGCDQCRREPRGVLVALIENVVVGTVEYTRKERRMYVQGMAVREEYRRRGVCRALLQKVQDMAIMDGASSLSLCAIEETGNVPIFERLGFKLTNRAVAIAYIGPDGGPVIQVDMERNFE